MAANAAACGAVARVPTTRTSSPSPARRRPARGARRTRLRDRHRLVPRLLHPAHGRGGGRAVAGARRGGRFEWPDPAGRARPRVHDRALVSRLRPAGAARTTCASFRSSTRSAACRDGSATVAAGDRAALAGGAAGCSTGRGDRGTLPIDHTVAACADAWRRARRRARASPASWSRSSPRYAAEHNHPDADCTSRLSPYLHFGHISAHEVFSARDDRRALDHAPAGARAAAARAKAGGA